MLQSHSCLTKRRTNLALKHGRCGMIMIPMNANVAEAASLNQFCEFEGIVELGENCVEAWRDAIVAKGVPSPTPTS